MSWGGARGSMERQSLAGGPKQVVSGSCVGHPSAFGASEPKRGSTAPHPATFALYGHKGGLICVPVNENLVGLGKQLLDFGFEAEECFKLF